VSIPAWQEMRHAVSLPAPSGPPALIFRRRQRGQFPVAFAPAGIYLFRTTHPLTKNSFHPNFIIHRMASEAVIQLNAGNFSQEVLQSPVPVLVDFWAEWCGPCKMLSPILDEIAREKGSSVKICKLNVDDEADLSAEYGIQSIPALFYFKNGQIVHRTVGVTPKSQILLKLDQMA
jgi:thioredoxin 1